MEELYKDLRELKKGNFGKQSLFLKHKIKGSLLNDIEDLLDSNFNCKRMAHYIANYYK